MAAEKQAENEPGNKEGERMKHEAGEDARGKESEAGLSVAATASADALAKRREKTLVVDDPSADYSAQAIFSTAGTVPGKTSNSHEGVPFSTLRRLPHASLD